MLIQKIFHVHVGLEAAKAQLTNLRACRRLFEGVTAATVGPEGNSHVEFETGNGFAASVDLAPLASDDPNQVLFRSVGGNIELAGMVEYVPVREHLTEVQLTVDYAIKSPVHSVFDAVTSSVDRLLNRQLQRLQPHFTGCTHGSGAHLQEQGFGGAQLAH